MHINPRFSTVLHLSGLLLMIYSLSMTLPVIIGLLYGEEDVSAFVTTLFISLALGAAGWFGSGKSDKNLRVADGFLVAVLFWLIFSAASALPFILDDRLSMSVTDAFFEGISGITTTGASVLENIDELPKSILYYRAQLTFFGGLGIIVLAVAILPLLGIGGAKLYRSEMPGPLKEDKLTPRLADTAKHLWLIYSGLALLSGISYYLAGMNVFDALCHGLSTVSLGGFSTHGASLGFYDSAAVELVGGIFSILSAISFALYFAAYHSRSLRPILQNPELRFFLLILFMVTFFTCGELYRSLTFPAGESMVHGFFVTASIMTDNGLVGGNYPNWPTHLVLLLLGASFFGGCVGSTCGGIKALRFLLLYRQSQVEILQLIHPNAVLTAKVGSVPISERLMRSVWAFFFFYVFVTCVFTWLLTVSGHDILTAFGTVAACLNNMGAGYGDTASSFASLTSPAKWLMCAAMIFGRLEIFPILIVFSRSFWLS